MELDKCVSSRQGIENYSGSEIAVDGFTGLCKALRLSLAISDAKAQWPNDAE